MRHLFITAGLAALWASTVNAMVFSSKPKAASNAAASDRTPLFTMPIPGSKTARLQIPGPAQTKELLDFVVGEAKSVGFKNAADRTLQAQRAASSLAWEVLRDGDLLKALDPTQAADETQAPRLLRLLFERLGATYVKVGQFIASSPTLFPAPYVLEFQKCLDQSPTLPFDTIRGIIEAELGAPISEVFESLDPEPLASASIAQVHAAVLKPKYASGGDGKAVVKVLKPGVEATLRTDLAALTIAAQVLESLAPEASRLSVADIALDLRESMIGELDLRTEADRLEVFKRFLVDQGLDRTATCPTPVAALTTSKVLTMSRLAGAPLLDAKSDDSSAGEAAVCAALEAWCRSVTDCDFFHADVHGGNILLLDDGRVGFLDFGIVGTLPEGIWGAVAQMTEGLAQGDMRLVALSLIDMGVARSGEGEIKDVEALAQDLGNVLAALGKAQQQEPQAAEAAGEGGANDAALGLEVASLALDVVGAAERNGLSLPREFGLLVKQALYFDRYIQSLAPGLNPLTDSRINAVRRGGRDLSRDPRAAEASAAQTAQAAAEHRRGGAGAEEEEEEGEGLQSPKTV